MPDVNEPLRPEVVPEAGEDFGHPLRVESVAQGTLRLEQIGMTKDGLVVSDRSQGLATSE